MKSSITKRDLWSKFSEMVTITENNIKTASVGGEDATSSSSDLCVYCKCILAYSDEGFLTCTSCGVLHKDILDNSAEWRYYGCDDNNNTDPTRCGLPINPLLQESSFGCKVMNSGPCSYEIRKLRRYTEWQAMPYKEKARYDDFQLITTMARNANISQMIIDTAMMYHTLITEQDRSFRGSNRDGILASSIYLSFKKHGCARDETEISKIFNLDLSSTTTGCKTALNIINAIESKLPVEERTFWKKITSHDFVDRYCSKLHINEELRKYCLFVVKLVDKLNLMPEHTPNAICVGIIYFISQICNLNKTKKEIHQVSEISEVTINKCYKILEQHKESLIPKIILDKYSNK
jgi:transcription initiation factor TFIIB